MQEKNSNNRYKTPPIIWIVRLFFLVVIGFVISFWLHTQSISLIGQLIASGFVATSGAALAISFVRSRTALLLVAVSLIAIPLAMFLPMNVLILTGTWWEWLIMFPAQMGIPAIIAFYMWKAPNVRAFFQSSSDSKTP